MTDLRVGLIGASRVAVDAVIAPARNLPGVRVHAVAARDPARARSYAAEHAIEHTYSSYAELLADPAIDLVYVGTPPACHVEHALAAIAAGRPVLVEKPFCLDSASAWQVFETAHEAGVPVFEAMHSLHHALFGRLHALLRDGTIGRVVHVDAVFDAAIPRTDPIRWTRALGGGALMDLGVYPLAWVRRLLGEAFTVGEASADIQGDVDARFSASLQFADGATAAVSSAMIANAPAARLVIHGERGRIDVVNPLAPQEGHSLRVDTSRTTWLETIDGPGTYEMQLVAVCAALRGAEPFPLPPDDYCRSMEAIERVRQAWSTS